MGLLLSYANFAYRKRNLTTYNEIKHKMMIIFDTVNKMAYKLQLVTLSLGIAMWIVNER